MIPYSFALAANQVLDVKSAGGEFFLLDSAPQSCTFEFFGANNVKRNERLESALPGDWARPVGGFAWVKITNGPVAQTVRFYVAVGQVGRFRVQGEVSVIEGGKARTLAGVAYAHNVGVGAVAAQFSHGQLFMPAGTGRRFVVESIFAGVGANAQITVRWHNAPLANLGGIVQNKLNGGPASVGESRRENNAVALGASDIGGFYCLANSMVFIPIKLPIIIKPGQGILAFANVVNVPLQFHCECYEEPDV